MRVLWLTNIPSPYRVDFFNEVGKYCELTVLFERRSSSERDISWKNYSFENFNGIFLKGMKCSASKAFCPSIVLYLKKMKYDHVVVTNFSDPTGIMAIFHMRLARINYEIESDGGMPQDGIGLKEELKKAIIAGADKYFSTARIHDDYYRMYGALNNKIYRYPFTSLHEKDIASEPASDEEKKALRAELGIIEDKVVLSVGQFIPRKGFDVLLDAAKRFSKDTGTYIIGGIPADELIAQKERLNLKNVHFVDFKQKNELKKWYRAADVFVLPTREDIWGLVINEAMAQGLPVVTTDRCVAGLELVEKEFIVPVDDANTTAQKVNNLLDNENLRFQTASRNLRLIAEYTIERMADWHSRQCQQRESC